MLEVQAHQQLKHPLRGSAGHWEHELTPAACGTQPAPAGSNPDPTVSRQQRSLVAGIGAAGTVPSHSAGSGHPQQQRLLQVERLDRMESGIRLSCWTGDAPPPGDQLGW